MDKVLLASTLILLSSAGECFAQGTQLPWNQPSDMVAWELFAQITAPAGNPHKNQVEFETWASDQDVYTKSPPVWPTISEPKTLQVSNLGRSHFRPGVGLQVINPGQCVQEFDKAAAQAAGFPANGCIGEEVRRNWASFQYIVSNQLYSKQGLVQAFQGGLKIDLPSDAVEFKGDWVKIQDLANWLHVDENTVKSNYYVSTASDGGSTGDFALVAFHFSSKQIKNWVWSDFENEMNPGRCDDTGCHDSVGAVVQDVPPKTPANQSYGACQKSSSVQAMLTNAGVSPIWQHYCLKGSQITFVTAAGAPSILGNSVIERINAGVPVSQSSCITCHAYASFDKTGKPDFAALNPPLVGNVDPNNMKGYLANDFIWGITLAH